jgi:hypothetical protein
MSEYTDFIASVFLNQGQAAHASCDHCPTDDDLAGFFDQVLSATETRAIEEHALTCAYTHAVITSYAVVRSEAAQAGRRVGLRIRARLVDGCIALLNAVDLTLRGLSAQPALGAVRGSESARLVRVAGPGDGLDEIELQAQADGSVRVVVSGVLVDTAPDGRTSVVLEVDGMLREKRPYSGERVAFAPLTRGDCRITVLRRHPDGPALEISEARVDLCA